MNKSKAYKECRNNLLLLNNDEYLKSLRESFDKKASYEDMTEQKARYLKGEEVRVMTENIESAKDFNVDNPVTLTGLFRCEVELTLSLEPELMGLWEKKKPDAEKIATKAFRYFDALKNSETYPMDILCLQILVSECVRLYFLEVRKSGVSDAS